MIVFDLKCENAHLFEGWFGSEPEYQSQLKNALLTCPMCGTDKIVKMPSAPNLVLHHQKNENTPTPIEPSLSNLPKSKDLQEKMLHFARILINNTEDVKDKFAEEVRKMHYGEIEERAIRGEVSLQQTVELLEEGVEILPIPSMFNNKLN
ncbi:MAG: DUF1178 family protein [Gammaproteobacteria bacterium]|nr:DUF1178 family protein [Gammaproteobacteria bacterium]